MNGVTCDSCGIARPGELVTLGIAVDKRVTVARELCRYPCAERVLGKMGDALSERFTIESDGSGRLVDHDVPDLPLRRRRA